MVLRGSAPKGLGAVLISGGTWAVQTRTGQRHRAHCKREVQHGVALKTLVGSTGRQSDVQIVDFVITLAADADAAYSYPVTRKILCCIATKAHIQYTQTAFTDFFCNARKLYALNKRGPLADLTTCTSQHQPRES